MLLSLAHRRMQENMEVAHATLHSFLIVLKWSKDECMRWNEKSVSFWYVGFILKYLNKCSSDV